MGLSDRDRVRYARQLLLPQIGEAGQARLCASRVRPSKTADAGALAVAESYVGRAGVQISSDPAIPELALSSAAEVAALAAEPALLEAARALVGALAAVHVIQSLAGLESPSRLPAVLAMSSEEV